MAIGPNVSVITIATAGNATRAGTSGTGATSIYLEAPMSNTGYVYIGASDVSSSKYTACLAAGQGFTIAIDGQPVRPGAGSLDVGLWYVTTSVNGEKCNVTYIDRMG